MPQPDHDHVALEFYMPVKEHKLSWAGGANLIVAGQLRDGDDIVAFDLSGRPVALSLDAPPSTPTLVLVPVETNFRQQDSGLGSTSLFDVAADECEPDIEWCDDDGSGTPPGPSPPGIYMSYAHYSNLHEGWPRGDPEIEVMLVRPVPPNLLQSEVVDCANESRDGVRYYNQNGHHWWGHLDAGDGDVLVADSLQIESIRALYPPGTPDSARTLGVLIVEDDTERCVIHDDPQALAGLFTATALIAPAIGSAIWCIGQPGEYTYFCSLGAHVFRGMLLGAGVFSINNALGGNDDLIGIAVEADYWNSQTNDSVVRTHAVVRGQSRDGEINLHVRTRGYYY